MGVRNYSRRKWDRLAERLIESGLNGLREYEIVESLLTPGVPDENYEPQAKQALAKFGTLEGVLEADPVELRMIDGIDARSVFRAKLVYEVAKRYLKHRLIDRPTYKSAQEIFDYLYYSMRGLKKEVFKVLYLNSENQIIDIVEASKGTVNRTNVFPREVMEEAIRHNAVSLVFVHNHPSGTPQPSRNDKDLTRDLVYAANIVGFKVLDHIIIGDESYFSFAEEGLIQKYENDFLGLMIKSKRMLRRTKSMSAKAIRSLAATRKREDLGTHVRDKARSYN
jgi:DNA repair protein RadC